MRGYRFALAICATLVAIVSHPAGAQPVRVLSPVIVEGELEVYTFGNYTRDRDSSKNAGRNHIFEFEYSPTAYWRTALEGEFKRDPGSKFKYDATAFENYLQLTEPGEWWMTTALFFEYERPRAAGDPDSIKPGLLLQKEIGRTVNTVNFLFPRDVGTDAARSWQLQYAAQTLYPIIPQLGVGLEAMGTFGEISHTPPAQHDHRLGPVIAGKFYLGPEAAPIGQAAALRYELGYQRGLTADTPATTLRWLVEYELFF